MTRRQNPIVALIAAGFLASCGGSSLPVIDPAPPPPGAPPAAPGEMTPPVPREIGKFPETPAPRLGVSIFATPRDAGAEAPYSGEWTAAVVNRLELNRIAAVVIEQTETIGGDLEKATARLAPAAAAKGIDVLIAGVVMPGGGTQARLFTHDLRQGRLIVHSEFEGGDANAVVGRALDDAFAAVSRYWFELHRGQDIEARVEVQGLRFDRDIGRVLEALAAILDVHLTRHATTSVKDGAATATYQVFFHGEPGALASRLEAVRWQSSGSSARLGRIEDFVFQAVYE